MAKYEIDFKKLKLFRGKHCPCNLTKDDSTICPCDDFCNTGKCICNVYKEV